MGRTRKSLKNKLRTDVTKVLSQAIELGRDKLIQMQAFEKEHKSRLKNLFDTMNYYNFSHRVRCMEAMRFAN